MTTCASAKSLKHPISQVDASPRTSRGKTHKSDDLRLLMACRLKAARFAYRENASEFAREMGISPQTLNAYERGRNFPDEMFLVNFFEKTGCNADWIFRGEMKAEMSAVMAARIGVYFPTLLKERSEAGKQEQAWGSASGLASAVAKRALAPSDT